jgi:hypothetical protein
VDTRAPLAAKKTSHAGVTFSRRRELSSSAPQLSHRSAGAQVMIADAFTRTGFVLMLDCA